MPALKNILVATDFSAASDAALTYGREFARAFSARLHILHAVSRLVAVPLPPMYGFDLSKAQEEMELAAAERLRALVTPDDRQQLGATEEIVSAPDAATAILECARDLPIDLIVVGTDGHGGVKQPSFGSVAERVVRSSPCPVLIVHRKLREFIQPDALETVAHAEAFG